MWFRRYHRGQTHTHTHRLTHYNTSPPLRRAVEVMFAVSTVDIACVADSDQLRRLTQMSGERAAPWKYNERQTNKSYLLTSEREREQTLDTQHTETQSGACCIYCYQRGGGGVLWSAPINCTALRLTCSIIDERLISRTPAAANSASLLHCTRSCVTDWPSVTLTASCAISISSTHARSTHSTTDVQARVCRQNATVTCLLYPSRQLSINWAVTMTTVSWRLLAEDRQTTSHHCPHHHRLRRLLIELAHATSFN